MEDCEITENLIDKWDSILEENSPNIYREELLQDFTKEVLKEYVDTLNQNVDDVLNETIYEACDYKYITPLVYFLSF